MEATKLNPVQLRLLQMFQYEEGDKNLEEMHDVLLKYIREKVDREGIRVWEEKGMSNETMRELLNTHLRTPYK